MKGGAPMALTLKKALACIEKGVAKARELGFNVTIASWTTPVTWWPAIAWTGPCGSPRRSPAPRPTPPWPFARAPRSWRNGSPRASSSPVPWRPWEAYQFVFGKGAVPLVEDGRIIGGIGVSGAVPAEHDHAVADAAAGHPVIPRSH